MAIPFVIACMTMGFSVDCNNMPPAKILTGEGAALNKNRYRLRHCLVMGHLYYGVPRWQAEYVRVPSGMWGRLATPELSDDKALFLF